MRPLVSCLLAAGLALASGCNDYEMFRLAGFAQEDFSNRADLLFLADSSPSMYREAGSVAANFDAFIERLISPSGLDPDETSAVSRATADYILNVSNRGAVVDFQLAMTSIDISEPPGPGDNGALYDGSGSNILRRADPDVGDAFRYHLLCEATCYLGPNGGLPSQFDIGRDSWTCGDPLDSDEVFYEYNDCLCGGREVWMGNCGSGQEEPLEAALLAMCRTLDPSDSSANVQELLDICEERTPFDRDADGLSNDGLLRENSTLVAIIVTDEGDGSRRLTQGDPDPQPYLDLYRRFPTRMTWAVIGPNTDRCNGFGATRWGTERFHRLVEATNGMYDDIETEPDDEGNCDIEDFSQSFRRLGELLAGLLEAFPLQALPDVETIRVYVDGRRVEQAAEVLNETGGSSFSDGWSYDPTQNAVRFHGDAVPDFSARVRIYYLPLEGMPRSLPF
ncbi:MAG: hypothetical protein EA397_07410 [Deltaproteobacteria bacterium]|nr:MAG: hypothetical protein EA397_07410 [Deltaproteobacteria bacterium]